MRIGDLARQAGVNIQTVRFYERKLLLRKPLRTAAGYRSYTEHDLHHLVFIKECQQLGFTLKEILQLAALHDTLANAGKGGPQSWQGIMQLADERLRAIDEKMRGLQQMRENLMGLLAEASAFAPGECPGRKVRAK